MHVDIHFLMCEVVNNELALRLVDSFVLVTHCRYGFNRYNALSKLRNSPPENHLNLEFIIRFCNLIVS